MFIEKKSDQPGAGSTGWRDSARVADGRPIAYVEFADLHGKVSRRMRDGELCLMDKAPEDSRSYVN